MCTTMCIFHKLICNIRAHLVRWRILKNYVMQHCYYGVDDKVANTVTLVCMLKCFETILCSYIFSARGNPRPINFFLIDTPLTAN